MVILLIYLFLFWAIYGKLTKVELVNYTVSESKAQQGAFNDTDTGSYS